MTPVSRRRLTWVIAIGLAVAFRVAVVASWHAPAGDGLQYYRLSQQLAATGRLAYDPPPAAPTFTRLPGYPLFLAYLAVRQAPVPLGDHLLRATVFNVFLDLATALLLASLVASRARSLRLPAFVLVMTCPLLVFLSCYGLGESLATFLATAQLWCAVRAMRSRTLLWAAVAGVAAGLAQLVRVDMVTFVPAVAVILFFGVRPRRQAIFALGAYALAAAVVFAPWPIRNQLRFGKMHPQGTEWVSQEGQPFPTGMMEWMKSWSGGRPGEAYLLMLVANRRPLDPSNKGHLMPVMVEGDAERAEASRLYVQFNHEGLSKPVDAGFRALARKRAHEHPLRQYLGLPLRRLLTLWTPVPEYELPVRTRLLGLPALRSVYDVIITLLTLLALVGAWWLRKREPVLVLAFVLALVVRSLLISFVHPFPTSRYVAEVMPLVMAMALAGAAAITRRIRERRPAAQPDRRPSSADSSASS